MNCYRLLLQLRTDSRNFLVTLGIFIICTKSTFFVHLKRLSRAQSGFAGQIDNVVDKKSTTGRGADFSRKNCPRVKILFSRQNFALSRSFYTSRPNQNQGKTQALSSPFLRSHTQVLGSTLCPTLIPRHILFFQSANQILTTNDNILEEFTGRRLNPRTILKIITRRIHNDLLPELENRTSCLKTIPENLYLLMGCLLGRLSSFPLRLNFCRVYYFMVGDGLLRVHCDEFGTAVNVSSRTK